MKRVSVLVILTLIFPSSAFCRGDESGYHLVDKIERKIEISPLSDYWIKISADDFKINEKRFSFARNLSLKKEKALAKAPAWIQAELASRLGEVGDDYANLILSLDKRYVDEITFSMVSSPIGKIPSTEVLKRNVLSIYKIDKDLGFVDVVDLNMSSREYKSTLRYRVMDNGREETILCPPDIYYWYVVSPRIGYEDPKMVYGHFWREYVMYHNDIGYPLLREKLEGIRYLWDRKSYIQPKHRTWNWSISNHPTAVEAISYWVGKTIPVQAYGDRPSQPNVIAHEHNGWCGELYKVAVAALRSSLIPATGVTTRGEDHVWQMFYDEGWHQSDNWWEDGGGSINRTDIYAYLWGWNISSIHFFRGDGLIFDITDKYLREDDLRFVDFEVTDARGKGLDGIRILVLVKGPLDWSWIKYKIWDLFVESLWKRLPEGIKSRPLPSKIYEALKRFYDRIPDVVKLVKLATWNYTDLEGRCRFKLGVNRSYIFVVLGSKDIPILPRVLFLGRGKDDKVFRIRTCFIRKMPRWKLTSKSLIGDNRLRICFNARSYQLQAGILGSKYKGKRWMKGEIDCFVMDEENFKRYLKGRKFSCMVYSSGENLSLRFSKDIYIVFRNNAVRSYALLDLSMKIETRRFVDKVRILEPKKDIMDKPIFDIGDKINISGIATTEPKLLIDGREVEIKEKGMRWWYLWDTRGLDEGEYVIEAECKKSEDKVVVRLFDLSPPKINVLPFSKIVNKDVCNELVISGSCTDNYEIKRVEACLDGKDIEISLDGTVWSIKIDLKDLDPGDHHLEIKATDVSGLTTSKPVSFSVINDSVTGPRIINLYHHPSQPTSKDNIIIYANISSEGFEIKDVWLYLEMGEKIIKRRMFRYASFPVQERHEEDPLADLPNNPLFGAELGEFPSNSSITYWIEVTNSADLSTSSDKVTIRIL